MHGSITFRPIYYMQTLYMYAHFVLTFVQFSLVYAHCCFTSQHVVANGRRTTRQASVLSFERGESPHLRAFYLPYWLLLNTKGKANQHIAAYDVIERQELIVVVLGVYIVCAKAGLSLEGLVGVCVLCIML